MFQTRCRFYRFLFITVDSMNLYIFVNLKEVYSVIIYLYVPYFIIEGVFVHAQFSYAILKHQFYIHVHAVYTICTLLCFFRIYTYNNNISIVYFSGF